LIDNGAFQALKMLEMGVLIKKKKTFFKAKIKNPRWKS
jgi:hypothetical protein